MNMQRFNLPLFFALAVSTAGAFTAGAAGRVPLGPKTTPGDADSVYRITAPGSYYLTGNLTGVAGKSGIEIASSHVALDLNGFTLQGTAQAFDGIHIVAPGDVEDITIRNGSVTGWGRYGVNLWYYGGKAETSVIEHVHATRNLSDGIRAAFYATIRHCTASYNIGSGIDAIAAATIESSVATGNGQYGMLIGSGIARGCIASENGSNGFSGSAGATIVDSTANDNERHGFTGQDGVTLQRCAAKANGRFGFWVSGARVEGCVAQMNGEGGIRTGWSSSVSGNTVIGYLAGNDNSTIRWGVLVDGYGNEIVDNSVESSSTGIRVVQMQGGSGSNHIEANKLTGNRVGLKVESAVNIIVGNTARNSQKNYQIVAGNRVGTIVVPPLAGVINGNGGGGSGTTDPWSNIAY